MNSYEEFLEAANFYFKKLFQDHDSGPAEWNEMKVFYTELIAK